jgi:uncharacterized protein HemX
MEKGAKPAGATAARSSPKGATAPAPAPAASKSTVSGKAPPDKKPIAKTKKRSGTWLLLAAILLALALIGALVYVFVLNQPSLSLPSSL